MATFTHAPIVKAEMLIRKPVNEVFEAIVDPTFTTKFWFTKSSGRLEAGKQIKWEWEMYGLSDLIDVKEIEENRRIVYEWSAPDRTIVEWMFTAQGDNETFVTVTNSGFKGDGDAILGQALDSMGGFTMVLCAMKALLEHNVVLTVVADKAPDYNIKY